ncbi:hypothetical protein [Rhodococcus sp. NPDC049939]|uniref:hypothetical protein n=1 Tax=Rhodococcus sp. NPDC049939 TaxID=3155511 RepID=UPI0033C79559
MARARKSGSGGAGTDLAPLLLVTALIAVAAIGYGSRWVGVSLAGLDTSGDPGTIIGELVKGERVWPVQSKCCSWWC